MKSRLIRTAAPLAVGGVLFASTIACETPAPEVDPAGDPAVTDPAEDPRITEPTDVTASARIAPVGEWDVRGHATFRGLDGHLHVRAEVSGLEPDARHGFHIHEGTSCEDPGEHLAPLGHEHGGPGDPRAERHKGDLGNLEVDSEGNAVYERTIENVALTEGDVPIVGRVVVVHQGEDDLETDPDGDAGDPVACGVIERQPPG